MYAPLYYYSHCNDSEFSQERGIVPVNGMASQDDRPAVTVIDAAREGGR